MVRLVTYASFPNDQLLVHAAERLRDEQVRLIDAYTPFPIHGLEEVLGQRRSRLPIVCFIAASIGCLSSLWFQIWSSATDWPINVGGKPFVSIPAFIPVTFEVTVLLGGLVSVGAFFCRSRLFPGKPSGVPDSSVTSDGFWLAVEHQAAQMDASALAKRLEQLGGSAIRTEECEL